MPKKHGAYQAMNLAKQGKLPDKRTHLGITIKTFEVLVFDHFGELNNLQQIQLSNMLPLVVLLYSLPMRNENGKLSDDWKWAYNRVEKSLLVLCELADKQPSKVPSLQNWIEAQEVKSEKN
jgi:hypothetical protein